MAGFGTVRPLARVLALVGLLALAATEQPADPDATRMNKTQLGYNASDTNSTVHRRELGQVHDDAYEYDNDDAPSGTPSSEDFDQDKVPIVGGMIGNLLSQAGPPLNLGRPGPPIVTDIPFVDDNDEDDVEGQSVSVQSVGGGRVKAQARGGRGGRNQEEQVQGTSDEEFKPEDTPLVGGLVGRIMNKPIPFVGNNDDEEEAQEYTYGYDDDNTPSSNGLTNSNPNSPTDAMDVDDLPIVGGLVGKLLGGGDAPPGGWARPGPPIQTSIPFVDDNDDENDDNSGDDAYTQSVSAQSVHAKAVDQETVVDAIDTDAQLPGVGDLVNNVLDGARDRVGSVTPPSDVTIGSFAPPSLPHLPPVPDAQIPFLGNEGSFNIDTTDTVAAEAEVESDHEVSSEDGDASVPPSAPPDISLYGPPHDMLHDGDLVHVEQGAQKGDASVANGFGVHALLLPALCVGLLVAITGLVATLTRNRKDISQTFDAEDSSELAKLLPESGGRGRLAPAPAMAHSYGAVGGTVVDLAVALDLDTEYNPEGTTSSAIAIEISEGEDERH